MANVNADTNGLSGILGSPRRQRRFFWVSAGVLLIGIIAIVSTVLLRGTGNAFPDKYTNQPAQLNHPEKKAPVQPQQIALIRRFIQTAVARKDLASAYYLVNRDLRGDLTQKQWEKGDIPVLYYHADNAKTVALSVDYSYQTTALFEANLHAVPGTEDRPSLLFYIGVKKQAGKWLVDYFEPNWRAPIPQAPG
jgi:hypothetical protein